MSSSFLTATAERHFDALQQHATRTTHDDFEPWATALRAIAAFDGEALATLDAVNAARVAAIEDRLASADVVAIIEAGVAAAFDPRAHAACAAALAAVQEVPAAAAEDECAWDGLLFDERLQHFTRTVGRMPAGVLKRKSLEALRGFLESRAKASSEAGIREKERGKARQAATVWVQEHSSRVAAADAAAKERRQQALTMHAAALAQSDHRPIRASATIPALQPLPRAGTRRHADTLSAATLTVRVASLNVQEHCRDGLNTFVSSLPHVRAQGAGSGAAKRLMEAMCSREVVRRQCADVIAFVEGELACRGTRAVCLQEVRGPLLAAVRAAAAAAVPPWYVHASRGAGGDDGPPAAEPPLPLCSDESCAAATCIVAARPFAVEEDVVVTFGRGKKRAFAAVTFSSGSARTAEVSAEAGGAGGALAEEQEPPVSIVAVHVRHDDHGGFIRRDPTKPSGGQPSNISHIGSAERAITEALLARLGSSSGGVLLAIGDWNGPAIDASVSDRLTTEPETGRAVTTLRAWPHGPTQYGTPAPVDGAVLWVLPPRRGAQSRVHEGGVAGAYRLETAALPHPRASADQAAAWAAAEVGDGGATGAGGSAERARGRGSGRVEGGAATVDAADGIEQGSGDGTSHRLGRRVRVTLASNAKRTLRTVVVVSAAADLVELRRCAANKLRVAATVVYDQRGVPVRSGDLLEADGVYLASKGEPAVVS